MLNAGEKLFAYDFKGYWKDVGTISSLWEANMDLLDTKSGLVLNDDKWKIYARSTAEPPHFTGDKAVIKNSLVTEGCSILGSVTNSIISPSVVVGENAVVEDCTIMPGVIIQDGAVVKHSIIGAGAVIGSGAVVGETQKEPVAGEWQITVVGPNAIVQPKAKVPVNAMIDGGELA